MLEDAAILRAERNRLQGCRINGIRCCFKLSGTIDYIISSALANPFHPFQVHEYINAKLLGLYNVL
jgi:hypothetical protein